MTPDPAETRPIHIPSSIDTENPVGEPKLRSTVDDWQTQFIAATDPLDIWLCIDGNYIRPATRQETEAIALVARLREREAQSEDVISRLEARILGLIGDRNRAEARVVELKEAMREERKRAVHAESRLIRALAHEEEE